MDEQTHPAALHGCYYLSNHLILCWLNQSLFIELAPSCHRFTYRLVVSCRYRKQCLSMLKIVRVYWRQLKLKLYESTLEFSSVISLHIIRYVFLTTTSNCTLFFHQGFPCMAFLSAVVIFQRPPRWHSWHCLIWRHQQLRIKEPTISILRLYSRNNKYVAFYIIHCQVSLAIDCLVKLSLIKYHHYIPFISSIFVHTLN